MLTVVTGSTGLLGNNVVRRLVERGDRVRVLVRPKHFERQLADLPVEIVQGDVRDPESCRQACQGVDRVVHSAAAVHIGWSYLHEHRQVNVEGTRQIAMAARHAGARLVHISTVDALGVGQKDHPADENTPRVGKPPCVYVVTKREAEAAVQAEIAQGLQAVIANPSFMVGPWDWKPSSGRMILNVATRFVPMAPSGGLNVADVRDVAAGVCTLLERGQIGGNYILGGQNMTYLELWRMICAVVGKRPPLARMGPLVRWAAGGVGDLMARISSKESEVNSAAVQMSSLYHYYTSARAERELGYSALPVRPAVEAAWQWFRDFGYVKATAKT